MPAQPREGGEEREIFLRPRRGSHAHGATHPWHTPPHLHPCRPCEDALLEIPALHHHRRGRVAQHPRRLGLVSAFFRAGGPTQRQVDRIWRIHQMGYHRHRRRRHRLVCRKALPEEIQKHCRYGLFNGKAHIDSDFVCQVVTCLQRGDKPLLCCDSRPRRRCACQVPAGRAVAPAASRS